MARETRSERRTGAQTKSDAQGSRHLACDRRRKEQVAGTGKQLASIATRATTTKRSGTHTHTCREARVNRKRTQEHRQEKRRHTREQQKNTLPQNRWTTKRTEEESDVEPTGGKEKHGTQRWTTRHNIFSPHTGQHQPTHRNTQQAIREPQEKCNSPPQRRTHRDKQTHTAKAQQPPLERWSARERHSEQRTRETRRDTAIARMTKARRKTTPAKRTHKHCKAFAQPGASVTPTEKKAPTQDKHTQHGTNSEEQKGTTKQTPHSRAKGTQEITDTDARKDPKDMRTPKPRTEACTALSPNTTQRSQRTRNPTGRIKKETAQHHAKSEKEATRTMSGRTRRKRDNKRERRCKRKGTRDAKRARHKTAPRHRTGENGRKLERTATVPGHAGRTSHRPPRNNGKQ
ncbi:hypothetical protein, conserved in T. vivax [Trypanosoma vivax Y486]|uniref:Uncharacterized protein n=1 Tax=Trypanosoma vivax (strain Y486) TaxID=1055687 RepID=F9WPS8_TRYVY|nr:hypothetical protein, conserved in T. vivax [Trypanosoma vivax Y486]|eukprot:CCD19555.1 hypothetical protein, conserved in T. vivax [Trypanosoma vivax Y486]